MPGPAIRSFVRAHRVAGLLVGAAAVLAWATPASAQLTDIAVSPTSGPVGTNVTVSGGSCKKNGPDPSTVWVLVPSLGIDLTVPANPNGSWSGAFVVPAGATAGPHELTATCIRGAVLDPYAPVTFTVPASGPATTTIPATTTVPTQTSTPGTTPATTPATTPGGSTAQPGGHTGTDPSATVLPGLGTAGDQPTGVVPDQSSTAPTSGATTTADDVTGDDASTTAPTSVEDPADGGAGESVGSLSDGSALPKVFVLLPLALAPLFAGWYARRRARVGRAGRVSRTPRALAAPPETAALQLAPVAIAALAAAPEPVDPVLLDRPPDPFLSIDAAQSVQAMDAQIRATAGPDVAVHLDVEPRECRVRVRAGDLERMILPLVDNAAQALAVGGTIRIAIGRGPRTNSGEAGGDSDWALVVVADNGPGIPSEALGGLRDSLATTSVRVKEQSGLPAVHSLVSGLGGHVDITSVAGHGTCVTIALPLDEPPPEPVLLDPPELEPAVMDPVPMDPPRLDDVFRTSDPVR